MAMANSTSASQAAEGMLSELMAHASAHLGNLSTQLGVGVDSISVDMLRVEYFDPIRNQSVLIEAWVPRPPPPPEMRESLQDGDTSSALSVDAATWTPEEVAAAVDSGTNT